MFLPFLPLILASLSLTLFSEELERNAPLWNFPLGVAIPGFLLFSFGLAQIPFSQLLGRFRYFPHSQRSTSLTPSRALTLIFWLLLVFHDHLDIRLTQLLSSMEITNSVTIGVLLIVYWFSDALAAISVKEWSREGISQKFQQSAQHLRLQLPVLILSMVQFLLLYLMDAFFEDQRNSWFVLLELVLSLILMMILAPVILVKSWGAFYLKRGESYELIQQELKSCGTPVQGIVAWPEEVLPHTTAGVIGVIRGFRYLMISPKLLHTLHTEELRAVIAHEAGHIKKQHLLFYLIAFFCFIELLSIAGSLDLMMEWIGIWKMDSLTAGMFSVLSLLLFLRFGLGYLSQNFERQADCHSFERTGVAPIAMALRKVAWLNGINPMQNNWHHYGIQQRIDYLLDCELQPEKLRAHHSKVNKLKIWCLTLLLLFLGLNGVINSDHVKIKLLTWRLEQVEGHWNQKDSVLLTRLGDLNYFNDQPENAEKWYRMSLEINPEEPHTLNNLAWLLTEKKPAESHQKLESIELAQKALTLKNAAFIWDTLAETYRINGDFERAHQAASSALELARTGDGMTRDTNLQYYLDRVEKMNEP